ncbi:MAG: acyl-CoA mutase large subunit family protein [Desulfuromonadales bacterium]|nr:acyl-CoA mutase large subunit family protein [Desulfuromonadales bacterium]
MDYEDNYKNLATAKVEWEKARSKYVDKLKEKETLSGLPVKTVYTPEDTQGLELGTMPGVYPFTRGLYPDGYALTPWMQQMVFGYGTVDETRQKMESLVNLGMEGHFGNKVFNIVLDIPSMYGIDSDHPEAEGNVGQCGVTLCTVEDYDQLIQGWDLKTTNFSLITGDNCLPALALISAAAIRRGDGYGVLRGNSMNWYPRTAVQDIPSWEPKNGYALITELIRFCSQNIPAWNTANIFMYGLSEAGATPLQELAYGMSWGKSVIDAGLRAGLEPDAFIGRLGFQIGCQSHFFEEVAKFRAVRKMWAKLCRDAGVVKPYNMHARFHCHTSGNVLTAQEPLNNTARVTMQVMAAVMGGAQSIHACSFDESIGIPTELSHRTALRTQQIMMYESGLRDVADPLAGSYYVECLTDQMEKAAWQIFNELEERGGYQQGLADGSIKRAIDHSAYITKQKIKTGKQPVVGLNKFVLNEKADYEPFRVDLSLERKAIERLNAFRQKRSQKDVEQALATVKNACLAFRDGSGELMPVLIEAALKGATNGEMCEVMRGVFGWVVTE